MLRENEEEDYGSGYSRGIDLDVDLLRQSKLPSIQLRMEEGGGGSVDIIDKCHFRDINDLGSGPLKIWAESGRQWSNGLVNEAMGAKGIYTET